MSSLSQTAALDAPQSLARLSALEMLDGYRAGKFTLRDVIDEVIGALKSTDALCKVMTTDMFASARVSADHATAAWKAGDAKALTGVPVTVKDLIYVAGTEAKGGAPALDGFVPDVDAAVVTAVKDAGAIITCKTTTCESGYKLTADSPVSGITRNPWHLGRTSGGSSGGAAAAIAAGCGPLAIATDGVGSIRVPCSFCGVLVSSRPMAWYRARQASSRHPGRRSLTPGRSRAQSPMQRSSSASSPATTDAIPAACRLSAAPSRRESAGSMACASASARTSVMRRWSVTCAPRSGTRSMRWRISAPMSGPPNPASIPTCSRAC